MIDVDPARARRGATPCPGCSTRMPAGYRRSSSTTARPTGPARSRAALGARVVREPRARASAPPASPGCGAATRRGRLLHGLRRVARPARAAARRRRRCAAATPTSCSARARRAAAPGRCTRGPPTALLALELRRRTGAPLTDLGPMRAARREALLELGHRATAASAGRWRWCCARRPPAGGSTRSPWPTARATGARRSPARCAAPRARCATWRAVPARERCADRASPRRRSPGRVQDAAVPAVHARAGRGAGRGGAAPTRSTRSLATPRRPARARPRRRGRRLAAARLRGRRPARRRARRAPRRRLRRRRRAGAARRHGHAAGHARRCSPRPRARSPRRGSTRSSARRPTAATGRIGLRAARAACLPRRADEHRAHRRRAARAAASRSGCASALLPALRDVDTHRGRARASPPLAPRRPLRRAPLALTGVAA